MPSCFAHRGLMFAIGICLLAAAHTDDLEDTLARCGEDAVVKCTAPTKTGVQYSIISWFKVGEEKSDNVGRLLARLTQSGTAGSYSQREVRIASNSGDIFLPNVTCQDAGVYECRLAAPHRSQARVAGLARLTVTGCPSIAPLNQDIYMVIAATLLLVVALIIFGISYCCLKNMLRDRSRKTRKEILLDAPLKPLEKKDLMLIYTLGPNWSKMKHVCV